LLVRLFGKRRNKISEKERKQRRYVYNFSEGRLKNRSWGAGLGKGKKKNLLRS